MNVATQTLAVTFWHPSQSGLWYAQVIQFQSLEGSGLKATVLNRVRSHFCKKKGIFLALKRNTMIIYLNNRLLMLSSQRKWCARPKYQTFCISDLCNSWCPVLRSFQPPPSGCSSRGSSTRPKKREGSSGCSSADSWRSRVSACASEAKTLWGGP